MVFNRMVLFLLLLFCILNAGFQNYVSTCEVRAFDNRKTFDTLRKAESNGDLCKIDGGKLGPYQISEQYYRNSTGNLDGWQFVWGKGSQSYSEMIIKSYVCKHWQHGRRIQNLSPVSVALIHKFGTLSVSSNERKNFRNQIARVIGQKLTLPDDSSYTCEPECNVGQCCMEGKCMCLNITTLEVKVCKTVPDQISTVLIVTDSITINANNVTLTLSWRELFNNLDPIINYTVSCSGDVTCPTTTDNSTRNYTVTNLTSVTNYTFSVVATNSIGSGEAGVLNITAPSLPDQVKNTTLVCEAVDLLNQCTVEWNPITAGNGLLDQPLVYEVYYNGTMENITSPTTTLAFTAPSLPDGVFVDNITVTVTAINRFGCGTPSDPDSAEINTLKLSLHDYPKQETYLKISERIMITLAISL